MSRIGEQPISIPKGVEVMIKEGSVEVKGPKGTLLQEFKEGIFLEKDDQSILVKIKEGFTLFGKFQGLYRMLIHNMIVGVTEGFNKQLELIGVGYRAAVKGKNLELQLGYSNPVELSIPDLISVTVEKHTLLTVSGPDKQKVGQFAADIRSLRRPEPYKGKGVRYKGEQIRRKAGKAGKAGK